MKRGINSSWLSIKTTERDKKTPKQNTAAAKYSAATANLAELSDILTTEEERKNTFEAFFSLLTSSGWSSVQDTDAENVSYSSILNNIQRLIH